MNKKTTSSWFEGTIQINCSIDDIRNSLTNLGQHYVGMVKHMPGITNTELVEQGSDHVIIKTNEGIMKRHNISMQDTSETIIVEFDEEYQAGRMITTKTHYKEEYTKENAGLTCRIILRDVEASGILGFFYTIFGKSNIGNALLQANKLYLEEFA